MKRGLVWLRQDLRLKDNPAVYHAAKECDAVAFVYILEEELGAPQLWW